MFVKPHFGPEEPDSSYFDQIKHFRTQELNDALTTTIRDNEARKTHNSEVEKADDHRANQINQIIYNEENLLNEEHKRHK